MHLLRKAFFYVSSTIFGAIEIAILWMVLGNVFRYFINDSFLEVLFLLFLSIVGPLVTVVILKHSTLEWENGAKKDFRVYSTIGLVTSMIVASGYMAVIAIMGFGYRNVQM